MDIMIEEKYRDPVQTTVEDCVLRGIRDYSCAPSQGAVEDLRNEFDNLTRIFSRLVEYLIEKELMDAEDLITITKEYYDKETDKSYRP